MIIRPLAEAEYPLLETFLYESIFIRPGETPPPREVVIRRPELYLYIDAFGQKPGDVCLAAEVGGQVVAAAWARVLHDPKGYGNIDATTPELAIAVLPADRGQGVGTALLAALLAEMRTRGVKRVSLSVQKENPAANLYRRAGFTVFAEQTEDYVMVCNP